MSNNTVSQDKLKRDAAGDYLLDVPAKALLLNALKRGALTEKELNTLLDRADKGGIRIVFNKSPIPERSLCERGFAALESACLACGLASGCRYWQEHGRWLSRHNPSDKIKSPH